MLMHDSFLPNDASFFIQINWLGKEGVINYCSISNKALNSLESEFLICMAASAPPEFLDLLNWIPEKGRIIVLY